MDSLPKIKQIEIEMISATITAGNIFIKDKAIEYTSIASFNNWMQSVFMQDDCDRYFPIITRIGNKTLIITSPCQIV